MTPKLLIIILAILALLSGQVHCSSERKPTMIVVLSRHGAREPLSSNIDHSWENPSDLMDVGIKQHYTLGALLNEKYHHLTNGIAPSEIYLQATEASRTQTSLAAELMGMFRDQPLDSTCQKGSISNLTLPFEDQQLVDQIMDQLFQNTQLIPNRFMVIPKNSKNSGTEMLQINPSNCEAVEKGQFHRAKDTVNQQMTLNMRSAVRDLRLLRYQIRNIYDLKEMGDVLANRYIANKPSLDGIPYNGRLYNNTVFSFKWWNMYNLVGTKLERSLRVFPIYTRLIEWFASKAQGNNTLKIALIGGHESTMFPFLSLYNISDHVCFYENYKSEKAGQPIPYPDCEFPEYGSQMIYEFYNTTETPPYIRLLYNGKPRKFCKYSPGVECTLEQFIKEKAEVLGGLNETSFKKYCEREPQPEAPKQSKEVSTSTPPPKGESLKQMLVEAQAQVESSKPFSSGIVFFLIITIIFFGVMIAAAIIGLLSGRLKFRAKHQFHSLPTTVAEEEDLSQVPQIQIPEREN